MIRKPMLTLAALLLAAGLFAGCAMDNGTGRDMNNNGIANDANRLGANDANRSGVRDGRFGAMNRDNGGVFGAMNNDGRNGAHQSVSQWMESQLAQAGFSGSKVLVIGDNIFVAEGSRVKARGLDARNDRTMLNNRDRNGTGMFGNDAGWKRDGAMNNANRLFGDNNVDNGLFDRNNRMFNNNGDNPLFGNNNGDYGIGADWMGGVNNADGDRLFNGTNRNNGRFMQQNMSVQSVLQNRFNGMRVYRVTDEEGKQALQRLERKLSALTNEDVKSIADDMQTLLKSVEGLNGAKSTMPQTHRNR